MRWILYITLLLPLLLHSFYHPTKFSHLKSNYKRYLYLFNSDNLLIPLSNTYDAKQIDSYYSKRPFVVWERLVDIGSPILGWWILKKYDTFMSRYRTSEENEAILNRRAEDLKDAIVQGKSVTAIKSGQALALRPDIVKSAEYIRELTKLQDEVGTFDNKIAFQIMEDELGVDPHAIYDFNPPTPIASASIGQVYRATLRSSNITVAVKGTYTSNIYSQ